MSSALKEKFLKPPSALKENLTKTPLVIKEGLTKTPIAIKEKAVLTHRSKKLRKQASVRYKNNPVQTLKWFIILVVFGILQFIVPAFGAASWGTFALSVRTLATNDPACLSLAAAISGIVLSSILGPGAHVMFLVALVKLPVLKPFIKSLMGCSTCCFTIGDRWHAIRASLADKGWLESVKFVAVTEDIEIDLKHHYALVEGMHGHATHESNDCLIIDFEDSKGLEDVRKCDWGSLKIIESGVLKPGWKKKLFVVLVFYALVVCSFEWPTIHDVLLGTEKCIMI